MANRRKYLTEEKFNDFVHNDFSHVKQRLARMEGKLWVIGSLAVAIFILVLTLVLSLLL